MARKIAGEIAEEIEKTDNLYFCSISEAGPTGKYRSLGIGFLSKKILTKDEGRRLILKCLDKILVKFNSSPEFSQYIENGKFTVENVDIGITAHFGIPDEAAIYHPDIVFFSFCAGDLHYHTMAPNLKGYYTKDKESYEEALRMVTVK